MTDKDETSAYIIGDLERGLTIVVVDPVMVVHYSMEDLETGLNNAIKKQTPTTQMAMLVRELLPILRGVPLDKLDAISTDIDNNGSTLTQAQIKTALTEIDLAATIARIINVQGSVNTVDFCIGLDIKPSELNAKVRAKSPGKDIGQYIEENFGSGNPISSRPKTLNDFHIDTLSSAGLDLPDPWKGP
jgi:hypothetical protein